MPRCLNCLEKFEKKYPNQMGKFRFCLEKEECIKAFNDARKEHDKRQKEKNKKDLDQARKEKKDKQTLQYLKTNVTAICHQYIRERDKELPCISCGAKWNKNFQAGHFKKAELYSNLKYHENNINGQCRVCNLRKDGNEAGYRIGLKNRKGQEILDELDQLAADYKKDSFKWDREELKKIREFYKEKLKGLK